ncbi:hypothetical protein G5I_10732 [Acromyrmex echinatior]|uniref:Uncharacterized protein n=1 Tax=Acromyrmex echinatior TaxID=103372 RepID=F4WXP3_ACREC|nr:hypothetical protein G5I_10732 [Acromyrmex echinatior]
MSPFILRYFSTALVMVPSSHVATAVMAHSGCSSYSRASSMAFSLTFADADTGATSGSIMARCSLRSWRALTFSALLALASAVNFSTCSGFKAGLPLDLLVISPSESEEITKSAVLLRPSRLSPPRDPSEAVDAILERASSEAAASARAPTLLQAGPGCAFRGVPPSSASPLLRSRATFRLNALRWAFLIRDFGSANQGIPSPRPRNQEKGTPSSPRELAYDSGLRNVSSGILASSPLLPVSGCGASPLMSFGGPSPPTTRAPLRVASPEAAPRTVQVTEAAHFRTLVAVATSNKIRRLDTINKNMAILHNGESKKNMDDNVVFHKNILKNATIFFLFAATMIGVYETRVAPSDNGLIELKKDRTGAAKTRILLFLLKSPLVFTSLEYLRWHEVQSRVKGIKFLDRKSRTDVRIVHPVEQVIASLRMLTHMPGLKRRRRRYRGVAKERKYKVENKTLPNFKPARSLIIWRDVVIFMNTIGEAETRILDTLYTI